MITIYVDCDDTILNSSAVIIEILNSRYGVSKTIEDLRDYRYRSIVGGVTQEEILEIYQSEEFWEKVQFQPKFLKALEKLKKYFSFVIISKGTEQNLKAKEIHLRKAFKGRGVDIEFVGIPLIIGSKTKFTKALCNMVGAIQIDDCTQEFAGSSASVKILIKNGREVEWNYTPFNEENFYVAQDWEDIEKILMFAKDNDTFMSNPFVG